MPPMLSDEESDDSVDVPEQIPARAKPKAKAVEEPAEDDEADEDDDDGNPDEYRVEKILSHAFKKGVAIYQIKWLGYDDESDLTWEPIENLENAKEIVDAYHEEIGGEPVEESKKSKKKGSAAKGAKRNASDAFAESPAPATTAGKKRSRKFDTNGDNDDHLVTNKRVLPVGSWEDHITRVTSIIEEPFVKEAIGTTKGVKDGAALTGLIEWNDNGPKTQHKLKVLRQKCPQKLLDYYEQHLGFPSS